MSNETVPLWRRKSVWGVAIAAVTAAGVIVGGLTIDDAGAIVRLVADLVGSFF
ncbi:hypothetical protein [Nitratireductor thuwali]|uniref:Uncharacterized protein n=1 Tax=Nitratireductor thuwali TaxID=2267699 RepID=A0ABY5MPV2_9HYPH|nr:hypothetical protein NTH_03990 [Nitratireductor thuwali]